MKILAVETFFHEVALTRPYTIAYRAADTASMFFVRLKTNSAHVGLGAATPSPMVTGETLESCDHGLNQVLPANVVGSDPRDIAPICQRLAQPLAAAPAARAAAEMALWDLFAKLLGVPLVSLLGQSHRGLITSVTIGIKTVDETLREAREYVERGFRCIKVKIGRDVHEDVERLTRLREMVGPKIFLRVDANQGYSAETLKGFWSRTAALHLEFIEQPLPADALDPMRQLPDGLRAACYADESLQSAAAALQLLQHPRPFGGFNIKLMKCAVTEAQRIATLAAVAQLPLMWGCMDESVLSLAAALHLAYAAPSTRHLDLDGSLDLAHDPATGGFSLKDGALHTLDRPGLGCELSL